VEATLESSVSDLQKHIKTQQTRLQELRERRSELRERYTDLRSRLDDLDGVGEALATAREQKRALEERVEALQARRKKARRIHQRLEEGTYGASHRRRWQWCAQRRASLSFDPDAFEALQNRAAQFDRYADRLADIREAAERKEALTEKRDAHEEEIASLQHQLEEQTAFEDLRERIDQLETDLDEHDFDPERFQEIREQLEDRSGVPDKMRELKQAKENRDDWSARQEQIETRIEELSEARAQKQEELAALREELEEADEVDDQLEEVEADIEEAEERVNDAQQTLGQLNERLAQAERDREALEDARASLSEHKQNRQLYKHLRTAFGKHGIPSLIIEETLPEIEERANRILDRLTDGRMHVRLETLKEKKSGGTTETLDIIITDEQGVPRPYETFSGGESFRVNFALRVALAQLLAERSGVRVRTLVIDEGFGTQDEEGIERLVEAIQAIRQDFAKILVITHLPRLKGAFPVRIEVEKDPVTGSSFDLVGA
jgi:exonuclease SbcC